MNTQENEELIYFIKKQGYDDSNEKKEFNSSLRKKFIITLSLCLVADLLSSFDQYSMTHDWIVTQVFTGLISSVVWFSTGQLIYDSKTKFEKYVLFAGTALGCSMGSTLMLSVLKPLFNSFFGA